MYGRDDMLPTVQIFLQFYLGRYSGWGKPEVICITTALFEDNEPGGGGGGGELVKGGEFGPSLGCVVVLFARVCPF